MHSEFGIFCTIETATRIHSNRWIFIFSKEQSYFSKRARFFSNIQKIRLNPNKSKKNRM